MSTSTLASLIAATIFISACGDPAPPPPSAPFTPPVPVDIGALGLPRLPDGNVFLYAVPGAALGYDGKKRDPITALGACTQWVVSCLDPAQRSLDACMQAVPACATSEPWKEEAPCCPTACKTQYTAVRGGAEPYPAFDKVFFDDGSCMPGYNALLGRGR